MKYPELHEEVLTVLTRNGDDALGRRIATDRCSRLEYSGIRTPLRRQLVKNGFSFSSRSPDQILAIWDDLWMHSTNGDVLFCSIDYVRHIMPRRASIPLWPVVQHWIRRVENWCHADALSGVYSRLLEADQETVLPVLQTWNRADALWYRRVALTSLVHYTGRKAVFLPPETMLPMVEACLDDHREMLQNAVGWVLRETGRVHPVTVRRFLERSLTRISATALSRATEHWNALERTRIREQRTQDQSDGHGGGT